MKLKEKIAKATKKAWEWIKENRITIMQSAITIVGCTATAAITACVKDREYKVWRDIQNELDNVEYGIWVYNSDDDSKLKNRAIAIITDEDYNRIQNQESKG